MNDKPTTLSGNDDHDIRLDMDEYETPTQTIVHGVSILRDTPVEELPPLHTTVDASAVNMLLAQVAEQDKQQVELQFTYEQCSVRTTSDGEVQITIISPHPAM